MTFGKTLKERRAKLGLTQQEVAKDLYVSRQTISNWENGKSYPDLDMLIKLSDVYQVSIDSLLKGDQELKNSLDAQKVESILSPMEYIPLLLNILVVILSLLAPKNIWVVIVSLALSLISFALLFTQDRMSSYISGNKMNRKYFLKSSMIIILLIVVVCAVLYFWVGVQNLLKILDTIILILIIICVFLATYNTILKGKEKQLKEQKK